MNDEQKSTIENAVRDILIALGDNPDREGLVETPQRVARMYDEVYEGMRYTNDEIAEKFNKCFDEAQSSDLVLMRNIEVFSHCEHHLALIYNMKVHIAYIPNGRVIGLSKLARIADLVSKRLQLQERITSDIADVLEKILNTSDIFVVVDAEHSCMTSRGINKPGTVTTTRVARGRFSNDSELRNEVLLSIE
ncbi:MAG: GTP cyclohydrolase I FolE [Lachnospiraceae bacterium]|nr:GTP cyclohydrolase I FolE [Lachnospiraceae bacterium]